MLLEIPIDNGKNYLFKYIIAGRELSGEVFE
jgi:hypothetical protein